MIQFRFVHKVGCGARTVKHGDVLEIRTLRKRRGDQRPDRSETDTAADEYQVFAAPIVQRKAVAVGAADTDDFAHFQFMESGAHTSHAHDAELLVFLDQRRRGDGDHHLAATEQRQHGALPALVLESAAFNRFHTVGLDGALAAYLFLDVGNAGQFWKINIIRHVR